MMNDVDYIKEVLSSVRPLPPRKQKIGNAEVAWWEGKPGDAVVMAQGGSPADRILAEKVVASQLEGFGYKRATFHFAVGEETEILDKERTEREQGSSTTEDEGLNANQRERVIERQDNWNDLVEKAKRLVNTGAVTSVRNSKEFVVGMVRGDHGTYESTIERQDPEAPVITGWHCECKWNQFAWQRTRQWKIYEGRPCSHVLALYFVSKMLPTEEETEQGAPPPGGPPPGAAPQAAPAGEPSPFATAPGAPQAPGMPEGVVPSVPRGPRGLEQLTPFKPEDVGAVNPDEALEQRLGPLAPKMPERPKTELTPEEERFLGYQPRQKIQTPPLEQLKEMQRQQQQPTAPGQAPYGQPAAPGTVSVPGARLPSERNPIGFPGGVWSSVYNGHRLAAAPGWYKYQSGDTITLANSVIGLTEGPSNANGVGQYQEVPSGSKGEVHDQDPTTGWVDAIFPLSGGAMTPTHVRCFIEPKDIAPPNQGGGERRDPDAKDRPFGS
jgi:hypothetical protein